MNWQCPRCETFNIAAETHCGVCDIAKPKKSRATKTAVKEKSSPLVAPKILTQDSLLLKTTRDKESSKAEVIDRRSSVSAKSSDDGKTVTPKLSEPTVSSPLTAVQPSVAVGVVDLLAWVALIAYNIYAIYDFWVVQNLSAGWLVVGIIFTNVIALVILGAIVGFIKWLISLASPAK